MWHERNQAGFSLLEVLIAVVVLSVGVLGISALQTTSSVFTESAFYRGQAASLATEIVERMRSNVTEAKAGGYNITSLPTLTRNCVGPEKDCAPEDIKNHDLRVWSNRVANLLPSGTATISAGTDNGSDPVDITVTLQWDDSRGRNSPVTETFVFQLKGLNK